MRTASKILVLVGGISAIVCAVSLFTMAIMFFMGGIPFFTNYLEQILQQQGVDDPERITLIIRLSSIFLGVFFMMMSIFSIPSAVVSFLATKKPTKGLLIANIILGYLSGSNYNIAGGIFGLIANGMEDRRNSNNVTAAQ